MGTGDRAMVSPAVCFGLVVAAWDLTSVWLTVYLTRKGQQRSGGNGRPGAGPGENHDVEPRPPSRTAGSYRRPSTRHRRRAQELLPRLQIVDPPDPKAPFRRGQVRYWKKGGIMEADISGPINISRPLRSDSVRRLLQPHSCRRGGGWFDQRFFWRRVPGGGETQGRYVDERRALSSYSTDSHSLSNLFA